MHGRRSARRPILGWVWEALPSVGVEELVVIRGYRGDVLEPFVRALVPRVHVRRQPRVADQQRPAVAGVRAARSSISRPTSRTRDIIFTPAVARAAAAARAEIGLVIDREFRAIYEGRTEHPLEEGEVADLMPDGSVARVGKKALPPAEAVGEYIGLARLGARGVATVAQHARSARAAASPAASTSRSSARRSFRNAYQTDLWQHLIDAGIRIDPVLIDGQWREIDTGQDLDRARVLVESATKEWS